ncbi:MAG: hypothetical protein GXO77_10685 [Calditrichaeota bacterium]|nr:hypothetical protein [Calditrichota bacterium]
MKRVSIFLLLMIFVIQAAEIPKNKALRKNAIDDPLLNRARAYLDKGKLKIAVENYGIFSGTHNPQGLWGDFQYISNLSLVVGVPGKDKDGNPYPWAVGPKEQYIVKTQQFQVFGTDTTYWGPTVSESWFDRTPNLNRTDWEAAEDSRIRLHNPLATAGEYYGKLGLYTDPEDQYPLLATSDIPETWPGTDEERHWPGPWAIDPADPEGKKQLPGVFVSDQDIYFEFDDRLATRDIDPNQGYPIGIKVKVSGYSYGASISEDMIFFRMTLINESQYTYEGMYAGFYFDVDAYNRLANGSYRGRTNDDDMMGYNLDWNFGYIYDLDGDHTNPYVGDKKLAYTAVKLLETPTATEDIDLDGDGKIDIFKGDKLGLTSWHWFDWYFRPGARDVHPTQGPWSGDGQTPVADNKEEIQYKILAGDTSNLSKYDSTYYFHPLRTEVGYGKLNPRFDSVEGLLYEYPEGLDCVFIMGSGPFSMAPGDSVPFSFCIIMGEDEKDLEANALIAQLMYDNNYQGARPPKAPKVIANTEDRKVTLYWDAAPVHDVDVITGYEDFEGFRIYRSEDNGKTWGKKMYDEESKTTYWEPYAQFDLENDIEGYDRVPPHRFLGDNSGLKFKFVDPNVENGREYLYAVCAYDRGFIPNDPLLDPDSLGSKASLNFELPSLENFLSNSTNLSHIVKVIPHRPPSNTEIAELKVEKIPGTIGNGIFKVEVIDPKEVTGNTYKISFDCDYYDPPKNTKIVSGSQRYTIVNLDKGDTLVKDSKEWSKDIEEPEAPPIFDGLRWGIQMSTDIILERLDAYWTENSQCTYDLSQATLSSYKSRSDYVLVFKNEGADTVFRDKRFNTVNFLIPFQLWNTTTNRKARLLAFGSSEFKPDVKYYVFENHLPEEPDNDNYINTLSFTLTWVLPGEVDEDGNPIPPDIDWAPGDSLIIPVRKPFERGDGFLVYTDRVFKIRKVTKDDLKKVKVVPNPYFVHADWENDDFVRKIQFTNLPSKSKVHIFTVSGEEVITLYHESGFDGSLDWDLLTKNRQEVAPGLYVFVVESEKGETYAGKFVIIK